MARRGRGFAEAFLETGTRLVSMAAAGVMADPRGQEAVARAVGLAQRGKQRLEALQEKAMQVAGIPGRQDYQELARQLARIKRKTRELGERLDALGERDARPDGGEFRGEEKPQRSR